MPTPTTSRIRDCARCFFCRRLFRASIGLLSILATTTLARGQAPGDRDSTLESVDGAIDLPNSADARCQRQANSLRFFLKQKPSSPELTFPRFNNVVHFAAWSEAGNETVADVTEPLQGRQDSKSLGAHEYLPPALPQTERLLPFRQTPTTWIVDLNDTITYPAVVAVQLATVPKYAPDGFLCLPDVDGSIALSAHDAIVSGEKLQFEPLTHKNTVGYWVNPQDYAQWTFQTPAEPSMPSDVRWDVHVLQGCGAGQGGSLVRFDFGNTSLEHTVVETGHFQNFRWFHLGEVALPPASDQLLRVQCQKLARGAVMDIRQIRLVPQLQRASSTEDDRHVKRIDETSADLQPPPITDGSPAPGRRVILRLPDQESRSPVYSTLYLPTNWDPNQSFPVIVEWGGNGPFQDPLGDTKILSEKGSDPLQLAGEGQTPLRRGSSSGRVEDGTLGYGLAGNDGFLWVCLPYLNDAGTHPVTQWWGSEPQYTPHATLNYAIRVVQHVCQQYRGDAAKVVLVGFSRGSIACNYLGLHDDKIAALWRASIGFSHYDGLRDWPFSFSDRESAWQRLHRLQGRPQLILAQSLAASPSPANPPTIEEIKTHLEKGNIQGDFTFLETGFVNHDDDWVLRPSPARHQARVWLYEKLQLPPRSESL